MIDALYTSLSGLQSSQLRLDTISNNVANVNTTAFKKSRVLFSDLLYRSVGASPGDFAQPDEIPTSYVGLGVGVVRSEALFLQGDLKQTDQPLDLALQGKGFFEVTTNAGELQYLRAGSFSVNELGEITTANGERLNPLIQVPPDATRIFVTDDGQVLVEVPNETDPVLLGQIEISLFRNETGLKPLSGGLFAATIDSGDPVYAIPGQESAGSLRQGFLETSNVDFSEELVDLMLAQRTYQLNARLLQASDEVLSEINSMRR